MQDIINTSHQYQCIFIHIPKVAGTSIKLSLGLPGGGHPPWQFFSQTYPKLWEQYTSFTVVRNPWDRLVSAYRYSRMKESYWHNDKVGLHPDYLLLENRSFEDCISMLHNERGLLKHESWYNQTQWLMGAASPAPRLMVDRVLRFENLEKDFQELCNTLGAPTDNLANKNPSGNSVDYRDFYNEHTKDLVADIYESDISVFQYSF